ncbi:glycosyltransferase [Lactococcus allomyrinae]|uniref:Glycosyltransferase n=1 Tax=Lactococcus allomyrinae TaxID=2419773 RepID=A0A387BH54_9LACT|nr:glycosyltransferase [Lactococcus allomyrinae]AYG00456.1 glycosyltransferase [Lactococcus allomyrinae]
MKTNKIIFLLLGLAISLVVLVGCSGSKSIQGTWKVQDASGDNSTITFTDKKVTVDGQTYNYTQNAVGTENGVNYYGIKQDGQNYTIIFPDKNKNIAIMIQPDSTDDYLKGTMLYAMNKTNQPNYKEYSTKYLK